jgi:3-hydroxyisobutyrate dehydrogenase-like beta-hydroxyacid dehydrogenase
MRIAILGLGRMGSAMARNLLELGHQVTVYNRSAERLEAMAGTGALLAHTVAEAVANAQVALTMVSDDAAEEELAAGPGGLLANLPMGAIHLCMSSISPAASRRLADAHAALSQGYVAAPVLRGPAAAAARQLWILVAGPELQVNHCIAVLEALGRTITRVGPRPELAHGLRLGATVLTGAMVEALAEVLVYGDTLGYPSADYLRLLNTGLFGSPLMDAFGGMIVRHDYEPANQPVDLADKDIGLALEAARQAHVPMPLATHVHQLLEAACADGHGARDLTVLSMIRRAEAVKAAAEELEEPAPAATEPAISEPAAAGPAVPEPVAAHTAAPGERAEGPGVPPRMPEAGRPSPAPESPLPAETVPELHWKPTPLAPPSWVAIQPPAPLPPPQAPPSAIPQPALAIAPETVHPEVSEPPLAIAHELVRPVEPAPPLALAPPPPAPPPAVAANGTPAPQLAGSNLDQVTHFEENQRAVWAWLNGRMHPTPWRTFPEVELAMPHVMLLRMPPNLLLNPMAVKEIKPLFGGRSRVLLSGGAELTLGRQATRDLKHVLGV